MPTPNMTSITEAIQALPGPFPAVEITNYYKGITLDQQGQIVSINPEAATIKATQRRTFPSLEGRIHLRSTAFPGAISGMVHPVDYSRGIFQLTGLSYTEWRDRQAERVQPKAPTYITMKYRQHTLQGFSGRYLHRWHRYPGKSFD